MEIHLFLCFTQIKQLPERKNLSKQLRTAEGATPIQKAHRKKYFCRLFTLFCALANKLLLYLNSGTKSTSWKNGQCLKGGLRLAKSGAFRLRAFESWCVQFTQRLNPCVSELFKLFEVGCTITMCFACAPHTLNVISLGTPTECNLEAYCLADNSENEFESIWKDLSGWMQPEANFSLKIYL